MFSVWCKYIPHSPPLHRHAHAESANAPSRVCQDVLEIVLTPQTKFTCLPVCAFSLGARAQISGPQPPHVCLPWKQQQRTADVLPTGGSEGSDTLTFYYYYFDSYIYTFQWIIWASMCLPILTGCDHSRADEETGHPRGQRSKTEQIPVLLFFLFFLFESNYLSSRSFCSAPPLVESQKWGAGRRDSSRDGDLALWKGKRRQFLPTPCGRLLPLHPLDQSGSDTGSSSLG